MVDLEALLVAWLPTVPAVAAITTRVSTELPPSPVWPLVRLTRTGGTASPITARLDRATVVVESWAEDKGTAHDLAAACRSALLVELPTSGRLAAGVVTDVREDVGLVWSPDPDNDRPRYVFGVTITAHP